MLKGLQKLLSAVFLIALVLFVLYQAFMYSRVRTLYPQSMTIAGVDVAGLSRDEARQLLVDTYSAPVVIYHRGSRAELAPAEAGFTMDIEAMLDEADALNTDESFWQGLVEYTVGQSFSPVDIDLIATHDREAIRQRLATIATFMDRPATSPQLLPASETYTEGQSGYVTDIDASLPAVEELFYLPNERATDLIVVDQDAADLDIELLEENIQRLLDGFDGFGAVFVMDLQTGEEIGINEDVALSGMSILKIPIFVEAMRYLDGVPAEGSFNYELFYETAVYSSNYAANQLFHVMAGENNTYRGADIFTQAMEDLGLSDTFMVVPYDVVTPPSYRPITKVTTANGRTDITVLPDPSRQTTAEDIGTLLTMLYYCAKGTGGLLAAYPGEITQDECQFIVDVLIENVEGNIIRFGVPEDVPVSHKHGWGLNNHGDAGIVYSPGGDFVIYMYLSKPEVDWLSADISFTVMREITRVVYNYFNFDNPNLESGEIRSIREAAAREAAELAAQQAISDTLGITNTLGITTTLDTTTTITGTVPITPTDGTQ